MEKQIMNMFKTACAAALASTLIAAPAFAQEAIDGPVAHAFYYPDAAVPNDGGPSVIDAFTVGLPYGGAYDSYAYMGSPERIHRGHAGSRGEAVDDDVAPAYDMDGRVCIPAPRVGAFATQPWDTQTPCEPSY